MKPGARQAAPIPIAKTHSLGMSRVSLASRAGRIDPTADDDNYLGGRAVGSFAREKVAGIFANSLRSRSSLPSRCPVRARTLEARDFGSLSNPGS
jgi:hypothetical protein